PQVVREHVARMLTQVGGTAAWLNLQRLARKRPARIRNRAAEVRVLDVAPVITLLVVRQIVVFLRGADHRPGNTGRLRTAEASLGIAHGNQAPNCIADEMALTVLGGAHRLVLKLRVAQLAADAFFSHSAAPRR